MSIGPGLPDSTWQHLGQFFFGGKPFVASLLPTGPFHLGRVWQVDCGSGKADFVIKERPDSPFAREHARLGWDLSQHFAWEMRNGFPVLANRRCPFLIFDSQLYQAWKWLRGESFDGDEFPLERALEFLVGFQEISTSACGIKEGDLPCVAARRRALESECWQVCGDCFAEDVVDQMRVWRPLALKLLSGLSGRGNLMVCHGDPWVGNWLDMGPTSPSGVGMIDWSTVRWDHGESDFARLIGSVGPLVSQEHLKAGAGSIREVLAWTGHVAALANWLKKRPVDGWNPIQAKRVKWVLGRLGVE